ncbi:MAG TPA: hypothetical protein VHT30_03625 [Acidimicrobiales bacterium]|jgi:hypothetical protein|nr:hypothetical protein [Acidimicrobiales bacterium]
MALGTRPARSTRRGGRPWLFFALLATVLILVVNAAMSARSPGPARQQAQQSYLDLALPAIQQSSQQGLDVNDVLTQALNLSPATVANHLHEDLTQAQQTLAAVEKLNPPADMKTAQDLLVSVLDLRASGTKALSQALSSVLDTQNPEAGVGALANVGLDFEAADRAYGLFRSALPAQGTPIPNSVWVTNTANFGTDMLSVFVNSLRAHASQIPVNSVAVVAVTTNPAPVNLVNGVQILPFQHSLSLQVVVANTGNQAESNLTVTASIAPSANGPTQSVRNFVDLAPGETRTVGLGPLRPLDNQATTLTASIQVVAGETDVTDNSKVLNIEMM